MKNPRIKPIFGIIILLIFGIGGISGIYYTSTHDVSANQAVVNWDQSASVVSDLLTYPVNDELYTVTERVVPIRDIFNTETLVSQSLGCDSKHDADYYTALLAKYSSTNLITQYVFRYNGTSQDPVRLLVTILPNKPQYPDLKAFEADFNICAAGGDYYPNIVTSDNLLFVSSCGTGVDDGSGRPFGCQKISDAVMPTMVLR